MEKLYWELIKCIKLFRYLSVLKLVMIKNVNIVII